MKKIIQNAKSLEKKVGKRRERREKIRAKKIGRKEKREKEAERKKLHVLNLLKEKK